MENPFTYGKVYYNIENEVNKMNKNKVWTKKERKEVKEKLFINIIKRDTKK